MQITTEEKMSDYIEQTIGVPRLEQLTQLMHLRAKELYIKDFTEVIKPTSFVDAGIAYTYIRKGKMACYIKKLF